MSKTKHPWVCVPKAGSGGRFARPEFAQHLLGSDVPGSLYRTTLCGRYIPKRSIHSDPSVVQCAGKKCGKCAKIARLTLSRATGGAS